MHVEIQQRPSRMSSSLSPDGDVFRALVECQVSCMASRPDVSLFLASHDAVFVALASRAVVRLSPFWEYGDTLRPDFRLLWTWGFLEYLGTILVKFSSTSDLFGGRGDVGKAMAVARC